MQHLSSNRQPAAMNQKRCLGAAVMALLLAAACAQGVAPQTTTGPSTFSSTAHASVASAAVSCTVDIGTTVHPLLLVHLVQAWLNASIQDAASSLNCGQIESLKAKLSVVAAKVDQDSPNADAACGASTALVNELQPLIDTGRLAAPTFAPPRPGGPTNVLLAAEVLQQHWCDASHGV
jgi:hypothetical protein